MKEIEANKKAWGLIARDHYEHYKQALIDQHSLLNDIIVREIGDVTGKSLIHLQCNTGADSLSLARMGARVTGVDLVPENINYARQLAADLDIEAQFIQSDLMEFMGKHTQKYDVVFTSEGVLCWLPDLKQWGRTIRHLLKDDGFFYVMDSHPFFMAMDEAQLAQSKLEIIYPYFKRQADEDSTIGGYASEAREGTNYSWMYSLSDVINSLTEAGLCIEFFNEYDMLYYRLRGMEAVEKGFFRYPHFRDKLPFTFSLKASVR